MKILHILDHSVPLHSGYTFRSLSIIREQRKLGWDTYHITSPKQGEIKSELELAEGLEFYRSQPVVGLPGKLPILNQVFVIINLAKKLLYVAKSIKPNVLHAHSPAINGLAALWVGKKLSIPVVYEVRAFWEDAAVDHGTSSEGGIRYRLTRALESFVLSRANAVTTICEGLKNDILARGINANKITVIPNAVDSEKFSSYLDKNDELQEKLQLKGKVVLGFIGSFYAYEGLDLLIRAYPEIYSKYPNMRVLLVGGGPEEDKLKQLVKEYGLHERVIFTGRVSHDEVSDYYSLVDIFVYPRIAMRLTETVTPLKPLEAMANYRLVVASNVGGHRELIEHAVTGMLFKPGDVQDLADTINDLISMKDEWEEIKDSALNFVRDKRNWSESVGRYAKIYSDVMFSVND